MRSQQAFHLRLEQWSSCDLNFYDGAFDTNVKYNGLLWNNKYNYIPVIT